MDLRLFLYIHLVVVSLLRGSSSHPLGLAAGDVNVVKQGLEVGLGHRGSLGFLDLVIDKDLGITVKLLELLLGEDIPLENVLAETLDGILGGTHVLDLVTSAVSRTGVRHGVSSVTVGDELHDKRSLSRHGVLLGKGGSLLHGQDVHAVDLDTGDVLSTLVVLGKSGTAGRGGTHSVLVVLTTKDHRDVPELGHVVGLEDLTLVGSSITVKRETGVGLAAVLHGERDSGTDGDLGTDNSVSSVEAIGEHVHGSALSVRDPVLAAEKLGDDALDGRTAEVGEAVAPVGGDDGVLLRDGMLNTSGNGLLPGGEMAETTDLLLLVEPVGGHLHPSVAAGSVTAISRPEK